MQLHSAPRGGSGEGRLGAWRGRGRKFCVDGPQPVWAAGRGARRCCGRMGRRRRGGRRATPQRRAGDLFDVAFVVEELVRDVEALWEARAGVNHDDDDRCDRHAFCAAACVDDWDRYDNHCRGSCGYCDPVGAAGCKACARRRRRNLIRLRMDFGRHRADVLAVIADYRLPRGGRRVWTPLSPPVPVRPRAASGVSLCVCVHVLPEPCPVAWRVLRSVLPATWRACVASPALQAVRDGDSGCGCGPRWGGLAVR